ncbi:MAG: class II aldolase/adducin family protein [Candidatus Krumholzibacteriia bacterium]
MCRRLYERGLVAGTDGNVSVRLSKDHLLATPTGMSKGFLEPDDLVVCDMQGQRLAGKRKLTTEIKIHLAAYEQREDVCAVVHAHPPYATAFAVARKSMDETLMPEAYIAVGKVVLTPYGTPSTEELEQNIRPACKEHDSILLSNHGAMTLGRDVIGAYLRMEALEQLARISTITQQIGPASTLTPEQLARLEEIRSVYGSAHEARRAARASTGARRPTSPATAADGPRRGKPVRASGSSHDTPWSPDRRRTRSRRSTGPAIHPSGSNPAERPRPRRRRCATLHAARFARCKTARNEPAILEADHDDGGVRRRPSVTW